LATGNIVPVVELKYWHSDMHKQSGSDSAATSTTAVSLTRTDELDIIVATPTRAMAARTATAMRFAIGLVAGADFSPLSMTTAP